MYSRMDCGTIPKDLTHANIGICWNRGLLLRDEQAWNDRLDRMDDHLKELQHQGERQ